MKIMETKGIQENDLTDYLNGQHLRNFDIDAEMVDVDSALPGLRRQTEG